MCAANSKNIFKEIAKVGIETVCVNKRIQTQL